MPAGRSDGPSGPADLSFPIVSGVQRPDFSRLPLCLHIDPQGNDRNRALAAQNAAHIIYFFNYSLSPIPSSFWLFNLFDLFGFLIFRSARVVGVGPGPAGQAAAGAIYF